MRKDPKAKDVAEYIVRHSPCSVVVVKDERRPGKSGATGGRLARPLAVAEAGCDSLTLAPESGNVAGVTRDSHPQAHLHCVTHKSKLPRKARDFLIRLGCKAWILTARLSKHSPRQVSVFTFFILGPEDLAVWSQGQRQGRCNFEDWKDVL
eukprot:s2362_g2.t1